MAQIKERTEGISKKGLKGAVNDLYLRANDGELKRIFGDSYSQLIAQDMGTILSLAKDLGGLVQESIVKEAKTLGLEKYLPRDFQ